MPWPWPPWPSLFRTSRPSSTPPSAPPLLPRHALHHARIHLSHPRRQSFDRRRHNGRRAEVTPAIVAKPPRATTAIAMSSSTLASSHTTPRA
jgi:hypothetical protein